MDSQRFVNYYLSQIGHGNRNLPGFIGSPVMYGRGLGSMLSRAFRFVLPFIKSGYQAARPHLGAAAKSVASNLVQSATTKLFNRTGQKGNQEGSGLFKLARRATLKRRVKRSTAKRASVGGKRRRSSRSKPKKRNTIKRTAHIQRGGNIF